MLSLLVAAGAGVHVATLRLVDRDLWRRVRTVPVPGRPPAGPEDGR